MLSLPTLQVPGYPKAKTVETVVDPGDVYIWQQDVAMVKKQIVQIEENKKHAYALVIEQCSLILNSKLQRSAAFDDVTNTEDVEHFKALLVGVVNTYGGAYGCKPGLLPTELEVQ